MGIYQWATGDRITAERLNTLYNLLKGVAGGTDTLVLLDGTTLDMSACSATAGFKPPAAAGAAPTTAGVLSFNSTTKELVWGDGAATRTSLSNPMTTQGDVIYGGASGVATRLAKGTAGQALRMNSGATAPEWAGLAPAWASKAVGDSPYTVPAWDYHVDVDASGGAVTVVLPAASGHTGKLIEVRKTDSSANTVTVDGSGAETINGSATLVIYSQYDSYSLRSDGTNVVIV